MVLITHRYVVQMGSATLHGPVSHLDLLHINGNFSLPFRVEDGVVLSESEADDIGECTVCAKTGLLMECSSATLPLWTVVPPNVHPPTCRPSWGLGVRQMYHLHSTTYAPPGAPRHPPRHAR